MRTTFPLALLCLGLLTAAIARAAAPTPILTWPGDREPLTYRVHFAADDYPQLRKAASTIRRGARGVGWYGLSGMTFSAWVYVPKSPHKAKGIVRFNAMPGTGHHIHNTISLWLDPEKDGAYKLILNRHGADTDAVVPFPAELVGKWVHIALSFPKFAKSGTPRTTPCVIVVDGQTYQCQLTNILQNCLASLILEGEGVAITRAALYDEPLSEDFTPQDAARAIITRTTPSDKRPQPPYHWTCGDGGPGRTNWLYGHRLKAEGGREHLRTPSGEGTSVRYYTVGDSLATQPLASGDTATFVVVGKFGSTPGSILLSLAIGDNACSPKYDHLRLERGEGDTITLRTDSKKIPFTPITVRLPDASEAFHCYTIRHERGELSLWVDGKRQGTAHPTLPNNNCLNIRALQFGTLYGGEESLMTPGADLQGFIVDDLKIYGRALTPEEIGHVSGLLKIDGKQPLAAPGAATPTPRAAHPHARRPPNAPKATPAGAPLNLPTLPAGAPLPDAAAQAEARDFLSELLGDEKIASQDLLQMLSEAEGDATRLVLLTRAENALVKEGRPDAALQVLALREHAFPGAVKDAEAVAILKEALRDTAVKAPDAAIAHARFLLDFALQNDRPKLIQSVKDLTAQIDRWLAKGKTHAEWKRALAAVDKARAAQAKLDTLRKAAADGDPKATRLYGEALAQLGQWDDETLGALAICDDKTLAALAADEAMDSPPSAEAALDLADRWWDYADARKDTPFARACRRHAADLYAIGKPAARGLVRRLIDKRIEDARAE